MGVHVDKAGAHHKAGGVDGNIDFCTGEVATRKITGRLKIRGIEVPLSFDIEARDDGDVVHILGRTTFTWADFQIPVPAAPPVIRVEDEVKVEVLLAVRPLLDS